MADQQVPQVLFVGSIHLDRMIQLATLPTPGETVIATGSWSQLGGKAANQAVAAAQHPQVQAALMACVGDDEAGRQAQGTLTTLGVRTFLQVTPQLPTGSSVALLEASGENVGVVLPGANTALNGASLAALLREQQPEGNGLPVGNAARNPADAAGSGQGRRGDHADERRALAGDLP